jgi:hypothetical protein
VAKASSRGRPKCEMAACTSAGEVWTVVELYDSDLRDGPASGVSEAVEDMFGEGPGFALRFEAYRP